MDNVKNRCTNVSIENTDLPGDFKLWILCKEFDAVTIAKVGAITAIQRHRFDRRSADLGTFCF